MLQLQNEVGLDHSCKSAALCDSEHQILAILWLQLEILNSFLIMNVDLNVLAITTANFQCVCDHNCTFPAAFPSEMAFLGMSECGRWHFQPGQGSERSSWAGGDSN